MIFSHIYSYSVTFRKTNEFAGIDLIFSKPQYLIMQRSSRDAMLMALLAAALFGAVVPASRILLSGIGPVTLAGLLYAGAGMGGLIIWKVEGARKERTESPIRLPDLPWLIGIIITGSIIGPILCMVGLTTTPASTTSLLLNTELFFTTIIALLAFREHLGVRGIGAIVTVVSAGLLLSYDPDGLFGLSFGTLLIILACFCWGLDNNFTRVISGKDPSVIVIIKGFAAGIFSMSLGYVIGEPFPFGVILPAAIVVGCLGYGFSIFFVIKSFRVLGSARTGALFSTAPFLGLLFSLLLLGEYPGLQVWLSLPLMAIGALLIASEQHSHFHLHVPFRHEHRHSHDDDHHMHHPDSAGLIEITHAHPHDHKPVSHTHPHTPDLHHYHDHEDSEQGHE